MSKQSREFHDVVYLDMLETILQKGSVKTDRTGTGTISYHGLTAVYDMSDYSHYDMDNNNLIIGSFPLLTTKKMFFRGIVEELLWFLRGETNIKYLVDNGVNIWNDWPLRHYNQSMLDNHFDGEDRQMSMEQFVEKIKSDEKFAQQWGELGPVYGYQWRNWNIPNNKSIDQIKELIGDLRNKPDSRRMIVSAWNVSDIEQMAVSGLPPCHMMWQVLVRDNPDQTKPNLIDLILFQRSTDSFLGAPFNIASYSLLLALIAKEVNLLPGKLVHVNGDAHIYKNHIEQVTEQLHRKPFISPTLIVKSSQATILAKSDDNISGDNQFYSCDNFQLSNYHSHPAIKGEIAV